MVDVTGADLPMQVQNTCSHIEDLLQTLNSQLVALEALWQGGRRR